MLVGLNADCFTVAQTATEETLDELEALLEPTAGGFCTGRCCKTAIPPIPQLHRRGQGPGSEVLF